MPEIAQTRQRTVDRMMVRIEHLDQLLGLAGEVIITSSNLHELERVLARGASQRQAVSESAVKDLRASNEATQRISQDLHDLVMAIRVVEIGDTFRLLRRPVRDLSRTLGRDVELTVQVARR